MMDTKTAITELMQSEKIKSGLVWITQAMESLSGHRVPGHQPAEQMLRTMVSMIGYEAHLARKTSGDSSWMNLEKDIDMALVMIDSGVASEASHHLIKALRQAAGRAQNAMTHLKDQGLL